MNPHEYQNSLHFLIKPENMLYKHRGISENNEIESSFCCFYLVWDSNHEYTSANTLESNGPTFVCHFEER